MMSPDVLTLAILLAAAAFGAWVLSLRILGSHFRRNTSLALLHLSASITTLYI